MESCRHLFRSPATLGIENRKYWSIIAAPSLFYHEAKQNGRICHPPAVPAQAGSRRGHKAGIITALRFSLSKKSMSFRRRVALRAANQKFSCLPAASIQPLTDRGNPFSKCCVFNQFPLKAGRAEDGGRSPFILPPAGSAGFAIFSANWELYMRVYHTNWTTKQVFDYRQSLFVKIRRWIQNIKFNSSKAAWKVIQQIVEGASFTAACHDYR